MLPGVAIGIEGGPLATADDLPPFEKGSGVVIFCIGNPMPIAVGEALMDKDGMIAAGMKGKGVRVVHTYRDCLWEAGSGFAPPGFLSSMLESGAWVEPVEGGAWPGNVAVVGAALDVAGVDAGVGMMTFDEDDDEAGGGEDKKDKKEKKKKKDQERDRDDDEKKEKKKKKDKDKERDRDEEGAVVAATEDEARPVSCWEGLSPDDMVYNMLLCAIKTKVKKEDLPCETGKFLKDFMQPTLHEVHACFCASKNTKRARARALSLSLSLLPSLLPSLPPSLPPSLLPSLPPSLPPSLSPSPSLSHTPTHTHTHTHAHTHAGLQAGSEGDLVQAAI